MIHEEIRYEDGGLSFQSASSPPSSLFSPSFDRSSTLISKSFTSMPPVIRSSAVCFRFMAAAFCFLTIGRVISTGGKFPYFIRNVDGFLLYLVVFAGSTFSACQQIVGHRAEVITKVANHDKTEEYLKIHKQ